MQRSDLKHLHNGEVVERSSIVTSEQICSFRKLVPSREHWRNSEIIGQNIKMLYEEEAWHCEVNQLMENVKI
jgi:hypothetical protein